MYFKCTHSPAACIWQQIPHLVADSAWWGVDWFAKMKEKED